MSLRIGTIHYELYFRRDNGMHAAVEAFGRWVRLGVFWDAAPGSFMMGKHFAYSYMRTGTAPDAVRGPWLRVGWWPKPCLTLLAHTRKSHG